MTKIQIRRDTSSNWQQYNPIPSSGEPCYETDTGKLKIGNGEQRYNDLHYVSGDSGGAVDAYTKAEIDTMLSKKEDTLTPISPISIQKKVISNLNGFSYTGDGTGVYSTDGSYWNYLTIDNTLGYSKSFATTPISPDTFKNNILIPYSFGQVVKIPIRSGTPGFLGLFGKITQDGSFIPIAQPGNLRYVTSSDTPSTINSTNFKMNVLSSASSSPSTSEEVTSSGGSSSFSLFQIKQNEDLTVDIESSCYISDQLISYGRCLKAIYHYTSQDYINRLTEINAVIILATGVFGELYGTNADNAINISDIGLYAEPSDSLYNLVNASNYNNSDFLGDNLFDLSGAQAYNYIELGIDNSTIKVNSNNQLIANIPNNITTQGNTFNGASQLVQLDGDGKLPAIDGSQLTNLPSGGAFSSTINLTTPNFNNVITEGLYYWSGYTTAQNHPDGNADGYLMVLSLSGGHKVKQVFFEASGNSSSEANTYNKMYMRVCISNASTGYGWSNWVQIATGDTSKMVTTDTTQTITATKTIQDLKISGQSRETTVLKTGSASYPNRYFVMIGDNDGVYNYIRLISQNEIETVNYTGTRYGKILDTVNFETRVVAGSGIKITKSNQGTSGDDIYTVSSTSDTGSLKYWTGTEADYTGLASKDADTLYRTTDTSKVFLGEILLSSSGTNLQFSPLQENGYDNNDDIIIE